MTRQFVLFSLLSGLLIATAGCCGLGRGAVCGGGCVTGDCGPCGGGCDVGAGCGPACSTGCDSCGGGDCSCGTCSTCRDSECGGNYTCYGPLCGFHPVRLVLAPVRWVINLGRCPCWCGPTCGETYWSEFHNDPPDCWDPCDEYGHWTGREGGCSSCKRGGGPVYEDSAPIMPEGQPEMIPEGGMPAPTAQPTLAPTQTSKSTRAKPRNSAATTVR